MKYCVIKDTVKVIDGSENPIGIMLQNAQNAGFAETEVEILLEEEYLARVELEPKPITEPTTEELQMEYNIDLDYRISLIEMGLI